MKQALGWLGKFIKCGLALFLLLLLKEEELKQGCQKMEETLIHYMDFNPETYFIGTKYRMENGKNRTVSLNQNEVFWQCFSRWKIRYNLQAEQIQKYLFNLENLIDKRVRAIVSGQHRAHYEIVAALAVALGEVKESMGEEVEKKTILQGYRAAFSKHSSFHAALRGNRMIDKRKNIKV